MSTISFNRDCYSRVTHGREVSHVAVGEAVESELRGPGDQVQLRIRETDNGSNWFRKNFQVAVDDLDGQPDLKAEIRLRGYWSQAYLAVTNGDGQEKTEVEVPVGRMSGFAYKKWFGQGGLMREDLEADGIKAVTVDRQGGNAQVGLHYDNGRMLNFTLGDSFTISKGMESDHRPSELA